MESTGINKIGEYNGINIYYDLNSPDKKSVIRGRGPIEAHKNRNNVGPVFMNFSTGVATLPNGDVWVPEKVDYETKLYLVPTDNMDEAIKLINQINKS